MIIRREDIKKKLLDWKAEKLTAEQVKDWAESIHDSKEILYADMEGDDDDSVSVAKEVIDILVSLDMNLVLIEDIWMYLDFLETSPNMFTIGYKRFDEKLESINYHERKESLRNNPFYAKFCF